MTPSYINSSRDAHCRPTVWFLISTQLGNNSVRLALIQLEDDFVHCYYLQMIVLKHTTLDIKVCVCV